MGGSGTESFAGSGRCLRASTTPSRPETVDHFSDQSGTFTQKFCEDAEFHVPGGPVFLHIGGEGPMSSTGFTGRTVNHCLAQVFGGTTVALEHRFHGKSQPFDSLPTEHLDLLTSRQALHDLVQFQQWYVADRNLTGAVFCLGGSYPGNLAVWYRLEFPDLTAGSGLPLARCTPKRTGLASGRRSGEAMYHEVQHTG